MARHRVSSRWICPLCDRSVPGDVPVCYCGTSRVAVEAHAERERQKVALGLPSLALVGEVAIIGLIFYLVVTHYKVAESSRPAPAQESAQASETRTPEPTASSAAGSGRATLPFATPLPGADPRAEMPTPPPSTLATPQPRPTTAPKAERAEMDVAREAAERRLERSLIQFESEATRLFLNTKQFESVCISQYAVRDSCERLLNEIATAGERIGQGLDQAEDDARRSWVSPGFVRDLRGKYGLDDSKLGELTSTVRRLTARYRSGS